MIFPLFCGMIYNIMTNRGDQRIISLIWMKLLDVPIISSKKYRLHYKNLDKITFYKRSQRIKERILPLMKSLKTIMMPMNQDLTSWCLNLRAQRMSRPEKNDSGALAQYMSTVPVITADKSSERDSVTAKKSKWRGKWSFSRLTKFTAQCV